MQGKPMRLWMVTAWSQALGMIRWQVTAVDHDEARWAAMEAGPRWKGGEWFVEPVYGPVGLSTGWTRMTYGDAEARLLECPCKGALGRLHVQQSVCTWAHTSDDSAKG